MIYSARVTIVPALMCMTCEFADAGTVRFLPVFEKGSRWENSLPSRKAATNVLRRIESTLKTSGSWDARIFVYFTDDEDDSYASGGPDWTLLPFGRGGEIFAPNSWVQIVQGTDEPNGRINPNNGNGADIEINWNFDKSDPEHGENIIIHEMMHGLGMISYAQKVMPLLKSDGTTYAGSGLISAPTLFDTLIRDADGHLIIRQYNDTLGAFAVNSYAVNTKWESQGDSGLHFRGISDLGRRTRIPFINFGNRVKTVDSSHLYAAYGTGPSGEITETQRAFLRGMGYGVRTPVYKVKLRSSPDSFGIATGGGSYSSGTTIAVKAKPSSGASFIYWTDDQGRVLSRNRKYQFKVTDPSRYDESKIIRLTAVFR